MASPVSILFTTPAEKAQKNRRLQGAGGYSEVVSGARDFVLVSLLMYLSSVAGVGHDPTTSGL